jgi:phosphoglycerate kinase
LTAEKEVFMKKSIKDVDVTGKRVLVRVDFNVPLKEGEVVDDSRIKAALPTIRHLLERDARVILCSHLGRPKGAPDEAFRMDPVARRLEELLDVKVTKTDDCIGAETAELVDKLEPGRVILLENTRFHAGEKENDPDFAARLAHSADIFVNDAFGSAHRAHASTVGVTGYIPKAVAGLLMERELEFLNRARENPPHPFVAILGGVKISDKIGVIDSLLLKADAILIGGAMANTFLKAHGWEVGSSKIDEESVPAAKRYIELAGSKIFLPADVVVAERLASDALTRTVALDEIPSGWAIVDIGPKTVDMFAWQCREAKLIVWNGPLGAFETEPFDRGSLAMARILADSPAETVVGGGDTMAMVEKAGVFDRLSHVSTGGGAFLSFLEGADLPGVSALSDKTLVEETA